ncbi:hypothetical protein [Arcobacter sp. FWKO B]|uniref:hypothetical protein n=1 Tax=Arcobacter sp. FWKO B TaxID=2593672 RepID=UPI0018A59E6B|nr:hypothetical protein [Arcobacter sp. FWKO B]QOG12978.1 hypothetical protein FWKOB_09890 [Arcobacter sp. FWKO B]
MNIVTFGEIEDKYIGSKHNVTHFHSGCEDQSADVAIIDINTIFDYEENKTHACKDKYVSVAIIDDESDYDAFKNFGIDAWIQRDELGELNSLLNLIEKRFLS